MLSDLRKRFPHDTVEMYAEAGGRTTAVVVSKDLDGMSPEDRRDLVRDLAGDPSLRVRAWTPMEVKMFRLHGERPLFAD